MLNQRFVKEVLVAASSREAARQQAIDASERTLALFSNTLTAIREGGEVIILDFMFASGSLSAEESFARVRGRVERVLARGGTVHALPGLVEQDEAVLAFRARNELGEIDLLAAVGLEPTAARIRHEERALAVRLRPRAPSGPRR